MNTTGTSTITGTITGIEAQAVSIRWETQVDGEVLRVKASGVDDSLQEVQAYGLAIIDIATRAGTRLVLCNERELRYRLALGDTWAAATHLAEAVPQLARLALLHSPDVAEIVQLWENTARNRGLECRAFTDPKAAQRWLTQPQSPIPG